MTDLRLRIERPANSRFPFLVQSMPNIRFSLSLLLTITACSASFIAFVLAATDNIPHGNEGLPLVAYIASACLLCFFAARAGWSFVVVSGTFAASTVSLFAMVEIVERGNFAFGMLGEGFPIFFFLTLFLVTPVWMCAKIKNSLTSRDEVQESKERGDAN